MATGVKGPGQVVSQAPGLFLGGPLATPGPLPALITGAPSTSALGSRRPGKASFSVVGGGNPYFLKEQKKGEQGSLSIN